MNIIFLGLVGQKRRLRTHLQLVRQILPMTPITDQVGRLFDKLAALKVVDPHYFLPVHLNSDPPLLLTYKEKSYLITT